MPLSTDRQRGHADTTAGRHHEQLAAVLAGRRTVEWRARSAAERALHQPIAGRRRRANTTALLECEAANCGAYRVDSIVHHSRCAKAHLLRGLGRCAPLASVASLVVCATRGLRRSGAGLMPFEARSQRCAAFPVQASARGQLQGAHHCASQALRALRNLHRMRRLHRLRRLRPLPRLRPLRPLWSTESLASLASLAVHRVACVACVTD